MTRNFILFLSIVFSVSIPAFTAKAQQEGYAVFNYNSDNGLPQNSVKNATIDSSGYLWLATEMGLVRFDGSNFLCYNRGNSPSLRSNRIRSAGLLSNGQLYCIGSSFDLYYLQEGRLRLQRKDPRRQMIEHPGTGMYNIAPLWKQEQNQALQKLLTPLLPTQLSYYLPITAGPGGGAFIFSHRKYISFISGGKVKWIDSIPDCRAKGFPMAFSLGAQCYYINRYRQLIAIDTQKRRFPITISGPLAQTWKEAVAEEQINILPSGDKMFLHCMHSIYRLKWLNERTLQSCLVLHHDCLSQVNTFLGLPKLSLFFAGTLTHGLLLFRKQFFHTESVKEADLNNFYAQATMDNGRILMPNGWIGTDHRLHPLPFQVSNKKSILKDYHGYFWVSADGAVYKLNKEAKPIYKLKTPFLDVFCFYQDPDSTIWMCAYGCFGKNREREGRIVRLEKDSLTFLAPGTTGAALVRHEGHLWIGATPQGLKSIDLATGTIYRYPFFNDKEIRTFYLDKKGVLWIGTNGSGFFAYKDKRFFRMPADRNNFMSSTHVFMEDNKGFLWISTNKGLFQVKLTDLYAYLADNRLRPYYHYYDKTDGFRTNEFNGGCTPAAIRLPDGKFSMPSLDGLVQFRPEEVLPMLPDKPIFIDEVKADTQLVAANTQLPASFNQLVIKISSPYFGNPYNQYLEYNLKGLDDNWYPVNINNVITFNQLPKGNYQLCIRKKSGFGVHQYIVATFSFSVAPAFNETLGFRIGLILLIFILSYLFLRLRYRYVIRQKNKLQREVAFHTREQKRLIDELYFNSKIYRKISQVISHDLRSPLRFLHLISRSLPADLREGDPVEVSKSISEIKTTSGQVVHFIEDFHLWVSTFNASFEPDNQNCSLALLVSELQEFFREMLQARNNSLVSHIKEDDYLFTDRQLLKIILRNLIDNANKYMANGSIHITLETLNGRCNIKIQDNGNGIPEPELQRINQRIAQAFNPTAVETDSKLGYQIIIDFVRRLNALLSIQSGKEQGTLVVIEGLKRGHPAEAMNSR